MRRLILLIMVVILSLNVTALTIHNTETPGENPVIYGNIIAFETHEDLFGEDLNEDGDTADNIIQYYDIEQDVTVSTKTTGKKPSIFAYYIVFATNEKQEGKDLNDDGDVDDSVLQYYDVGEQKTINTKIDAQNPYLYQYLVVFSTPEKALGKDYNNDADLDDSVIRYYDLKKQELTTTRQIGDYPTTNGKRVLFITDEKEANIDLNGDGYLTSKIFQVYSLETKTAFSTKKSGFVNTMNKNGITCFIQNDKLIIYDSGGDEKKSTDLFANNCRAKDDLILFEYESLINIYDLEKKSQIKTNIYGSNSDLFENKIAFQTKEENSGDLNSDRDQKDTIIRYALFTDNDEDGLNDIIDNCPSIENENQKDIDEDGIGDECDPKDDRTKEQKEAQTIVEEIQIEPEEISEPENKISWGAWFGIIMILLIVIIAAILILPSYIKKRKKGFGF